MTIHVEHCFCWRPPFPLSFLSRATNERFPSFCFLQDQAVEDGVEVACPNTTGVFADALLGGGFTAAGGSSCAVDIFDDVGDDGIVVFSVDLELYKNDRALIELENDDGVVFGFDDGVV